MILTLKRAIGARWRSWYVYTHSDLDYLREVALQKERVRRLQMEEALRRSFPELKHYDIIAPSAIEMVGKEHVSMMHQLGVFENEELG